MSIFSTSFVLFFIVFLFVYHTWATSPRKKVTLLNIGLLSTYGLFFPIVASYLIFVVFCCHIAQNIKNVKASTICVLIITAVLLFIKILEAIPAHQRVLNLGTTLGVSYYSFCAISYCIEDYKNNLNWGFFKKLSFIGFFPTISSGPINRPQQWELGLNNNCSDVLKTNFAKYLSYLVVGLFFKLTISSNISPFVAELYFDTSSLNFFSALCAMYAYSLELFFDFAGYSAIVYALCGFLGFNVSINFLSPYHSKSFAQFWKKWHISFSSWLRDYLYIALLGGSKNLTPYRSAVNTIVVMLVCAMWHSIGLTFLIWGMWHAFFIVLDRFTNYSEKIPSDMLKVFICFNLVCAGWVFFKCQSVTQAIDLFSSMTNFDNKSIVVFIQKSLPDILMLVFAMSIVYKEPAIICRLEKLFTKLISSGSSAALSLTLCVFWLICIKLAPSGIPQFIYYNF